MKNVIDEGDPNRILKLKLQPCADHDALLNAVADNLAYDLNNVHDIEPIETTNPAHSIHTYGLRLTFHNVRGNRGAVGDILDALNMRDWRMVCDRFLCVMLEIIGRNPESYDWPTPNVKVTYSGDPDADDLTTSVKLEWDVDEATYLSATSYEQFKRKTSADLKKRKRDAQFWVLLHRIEFEEQAQQTENVDPFLFANKEDAVARAISVYRSDCNRYFGKGSWCEEDEQTIRKELLSEGSVCVCVTDSDNIVFELYRRSVLS